MPKSKEKLLSELNPHSLLDFERWGIDTLKELFQVNGEYFDRDELIQEIEILEALIFLFSKYNSRVVLIEIWNTRNELRDKLVREKICPICGGDLESRTEKTTVPYGDTRVEMEDYILRCQYCEEEF